MLIKDLIQKLQDLYDSYDDHHKRIMGEPVIMIDVFKEDAENGYTYLYSGFSSDIIIETSSDGLYPILTAFATTYDEAKDES